MSKTPACAEESVVAPGSEHPLAANPVQTRLLLRPAPHIHCGMTVSRVMWRVALSLLPATIASVVLFGWAAVTVIVSCVLGAVAAEAVSLSLRRRPIDIMDGSAVVTGLLLALTLPPSSPVWANVLGSFVAIGLGKQVFGGLGANPFNPALVGRAFLFISFPDLLARWTAPFDAATTATPLVTATSVAGEWGTYLLGTHAGSLGETSAIALLLGGVYLIARRLIDWRLPVSILGTVVLVSLATGADPMFQLLAGGLLIGAFFMATDWVTSPVTRLGRVIYGVGIGFLVMVIRLWGSLPEGVTFAILFMNAATPLINIVTRPRLETRSDRTSRRTMAERGDLASILVVMGAVAALSGVLLSSFYSLMQPRIEALREQEAGEGFRVIFPQADRFEAVNLGDLLPKTVNNPVYRAVTAEGVQEGIGYVARTSGFQGDISLLVGLDPETGAIVGLRILSHTETAGLGSKVADEAYLSQFIGKTAADAFAIGQDVDAISGATVSSTAVTNGVRDSARAVLAALSGEATAREDESVAGVDLKAVFPQAKEFVSVAVADGLRDHVHGPIYRAIGSNGAELGVVYVAHSAGFGGDISLLVGVDTRKQTIVDLMVLEQSETPGLGSKVTEEDYLQQFWGKSVNDAFLVGKDVDGISGATVSASAVANGVRDTARAVLEALAGKQAVKPSTLAVSASSPRSTAAPAPAVRAQTVTAGASAQIDKETEAGFKAIFTEAKSFTTMRLSGTLPEGVDEPIFRVADSAGKELGVAYVVRPIGFEGEIVTAVGLDTKRGTVVGVKVLTQNETPGLGAMVAEDSYLAQYKGKSVHDGFMVGKDIDTITSATISSSALANSVRDSARGVLHALGIGQ